MKKLCFITPFWIMFAVSLSQAAIVTPLYPQYRLTPLSPTSSDSVSFWWVVGKSNQTCYPRYGTSFSLSTNNGYTNIKISYHEFILGIACMPMADTVEYGPLFVFGKLAAGMYIITDSLTNLGLDTFSVIANMPIPKDSVTVTPVSPTTKDSLDFSLFGATLACGGTVHNDTVLLVNDTCIYLSFSYQECLVCGCGSMGRWIPFYSKPLKAGTYGIYKAQSAYCPPGAMCILPPIIPLRVGQVTVRATSAVLAGPVTVVNRATLSFEPSSKLLILSLPSAQRVSLEFYGLNGKIISSVLNNSKLAAGSHTLTLNSRAKACGCLIARLKSDAGEMTTLLTIPK